MAELRHTSHNVKSSKLIQHRSDIVLETDRNLAIALEERTLALDSGTLSPTPQRLSIRQTLIESEDSDPNGFERILGTSNLVSINYLKRGLQAAAAVCRIRVPTQGGEWYGTAFLIGPRLLMTNNHVLNSKKEASQTEAEFNFEHDVDGVLNPPIQFNLAPEEIFFTDVEHDVTLVSVARYSDGGVPIERFGYLPLIPLSGKGVNGEWVTIIQHPDGKPKQMSVRESRIVNLDENDTTYHPARYIHYTADTEPGSSGAPVLNDQWQVVAIHHKAVPSPNSMPEAIGDEDSSEIEWLANQGVRISAIFRKLESVRFANIDAAAALERLSSSIRLPALPSNVPNYSLDVLLEREGRPLNEDHWVNAEYGYDPDFLPVNLDLNQILDSRRNNAVNLKGSDSVILDYLHFSSIIDKDRKFSMLTAVNIFGKKLDSPGQTSHSWRRDIRIDEEYQLGDNFYKEALGDDPVAFQRGHLVRRLDPCWGDRLEEVRLAEKHTYHFTNAAPHVARYNNVDWGDLEDYILDQTQTLDKKVTVFTGPIFKEDDPPYGFTREGGPWQIPVIFWKIVVAEKPSNQIAAAAFMVGQIEYLQALYETRVFSGLSPYTFDELKTRRIQTTIQTVEKETGFNFSKLRPFDALDALESTRQVRFIQGNNQIVF